MTDNRRYLKRIWRVPKPAKSGSGKFLPVRPDERFAVLVVKMLRKHGWPAEHVLVRGTDFGAFDLLYEGRDVPPDDYLAAVGTAVRICASAHKVRVTHWGGCVTFDTQYVVMMDGRFKELPLQPGRVYKLE